MKAKIQSQEQKVKNADKARLSANARAVYLAGVAGLKNCEAVARSGNQGKGYTVPSYELW